MRATPVARDVESVEAGEAPNLGRKLLELVALTIEQRKASHVAYGCRKRLEMSQSWKLLYRMEDM